MIYTLHHCPGRGPNTARGAPRLSGVRSNANGVHPSFAGVAIVPNGVHPGIQRVKNLVGVVFWGVISYWGAPHSCKIYKMLSFTPP